MWNAWGIAWGDSWGTSWGPLHEVEERPGQVYGSGGRRRSVPPDKLLTHDEDLIAKVRDKWEAIEAARVQKVPVSSTQSGQPVQKNRQIKHVTAQPLALTGVETTLIRVPDTSKSDTQRERNKQAMAVALAMLV